MQLLGARALEFFSAFGSYNILTGGTNVYNLGGYTGSTKINNVDSLESVTPNISFYSQLLDSISRLSEYRNSYLSDTILTLYKEAVMGVIDINVPQLITIKDDKKGAWTKKINDILDDIGFRTLIENSIEDAIYYGSESKFCDVEGPDDKKRAKLKDIKFNSTVGYYPDKRMYICQTTDRLVFKNSILKFGFDNLRLNLDIKSQEDLGLISKLGSDKEDPFFESPKVICSKPLFLSCEMKVKEYILNDLISAFLSLIILIEQDTYTIDGQRTTDMDSLLALCDRVKGLLVTQDDMNLLASTRLNKEALVRRLFDRIRVIPSIANAVQGMQKLQANDLRSRLDMLNQQKETGRDEVLTTIGFPLDLFKGGTNRWEAERQNDRYSIKVITIRNMVEKALRNAVLMILDKIGYECSYSAIQTNCFKKTYYEMQNELNLINNKRELLDATSTLLRTTSDFKSIETIKDKAPLESLVNETFNDIGLHAKVDLKAKQEEV